MQKKILKITFVSNIWHGAFNSDTIPSFPQNFGRNLLEEKYKTQWFEGEVSPASIESVCINSDEEENSDNEYESDSVILVQKHKQLLSYF